MLPHAIGQEHGGSVFSERLSDILPVSNIKTKYMLNSI